MAKAKRFSRAGTTVNVYGAAARRRAASRRAAPKKSITTTRTIHQVYKGPTKSESNTGLIVGGAALAALGAAILFWPSNASAATAPGGQGGQGGQGGGAGIPNMPPVPPGTPPQTVPTNPAFPPIPGASGGYSGPGGYRATAPSGLRIRSAPSSTSAIVRDANLQPIGTAVTVVADAGNGWFQVSSPAPGFMCASCAQAPGGPWLVRQS